jgi:catechol 2,3-dioxygenase-like lactoylglutathione lyase family enzyme
MKIKSIDHLVLTVADISRTCRFYTEILQMEEVTFLNDRKALKFGDHKINLHQQGQEFNPKAHKPKAGSIDICFVVETPLHEVISELQAKDIQIEQGPVERTGANHALISIYIRDPDGNLIELSNIIEGTEI